MSQTWIPQDDAKERRPIRKFRQRKQRLNTARIRRNGAPNAIPASKGGLTVSVPIRLKRRGGRKIIALPGTEVSQTHPTALQLALARGHRWLAMLESAEVQSLKDIAVREGVCSSYVSRMLNLTLLTPDIVAAIFDDTLRVPFTHPRQPEIPSPHDRAIT